MVDVTRPEEPRIVWHQHDADGLKEAETVLVAQNRLFLGTHDFFSIDITNPSEPVFQARVSDRSWMTSINGMVRRGNSIFAACKHGWICRLDVSDPLHAALVAALNVREKYDIGWPHDVDVFKEFLIVPDPQRFGRLDKPGKVAVLRVFCADGQPLPLDEWELEGLVASPRLVGANRVQVSGHHAFVGASSHKDGGRLIVVDLSEAHSPQQVAWLPFAPQDGWGPNGLAVAGQVVFLAGGQSVEAIDVSRPEQPVKLASQRFADEFQNARPRYPGGGDSGHDLVYRDGYLYVTGQNDNCLMILRVESKLIRQLAEQAISEREGNP